MKRVTRVLGRIKASFIEFKNSNTPMPDPPEYTPPVVTFKNLRKLPLSKHREILSDAFGEYRRSFDDSFAWSKNRTKADEEDGDSAMQQRRRQLDALVKSVRESTHKTPEDLEMAKKEMAELMSELHDSRHDLKALAQERLDVIRLSLSEFSAGYREARDTEVKRVMEMDENVLQDFLKERAAEVQHASKVIAETIVEDKTKTGKGEKEDDGEEEASSEGKDEGFRSFLSPTARDAIDGVLQDPDVSELRARVKGFGRERLLKAEEAARIINEGKGKQASSSEKKNSPEADSKGKAGTVDTAGGATAGGSVPDEKMVSHAVGMEEGRTGDEVKVGGDSEGGRMSRAPEETPILSGLASDTREFLEGQAKELKDGAKELWDAAQEVRESRRREGDSSDGASSGSCDNSPKSLTTGHESFGEEEAARVTPKKAARDSGNGGETGEEGGDHEEEQQRTRPSK